MRNQGYKNHIILGDSIKHSNEHGFWKHGDKEVSDAAKAGILKDSEDKDVDVAELKRHARKYGLLREPTQNNQIHQQNKKALIDELNKGEFNLSNMEHAHDNGYYDNTIQQASKEALIKNLNADKFDEQHIQHAHDNGYYDNEIQQASKQSLIRKLNAGRNDIHKHGTHALSNNYWDDDVEKALEQYHKIKGV